MKHTLGMVIRKLESLKNDGYGNIQVKMLIAEDDKSKSRLLDIKTVISFLDEVQDSSTDKPNTIGPDLYRIMFSSIKCDDVEDIVFTVSDLLEELKKYSLAINNKDKVLVNIYHSKLYPIGSIYYFVKNKNPEVKFVCISNVQVEEDELCN